MRGSGGWTARLTGVAMALFGAVLARAGLVLIGEGGTLYYAAAGLLILAAGILLILRRRLALLVYALVVLGTLAFGLVEAGLDFWPLAGRGGLIVLIGLWLLIPPLRRALRGGVPRAASVLALSLVAAAIAGIAAAILAPHDSAGTLPLAMASAPATDVPDGDWPAYGRTNRGERYAPLADITPENVARLKPAWTYHTGALRRAGDFAGMTFEATPIKIGARLYLCASDTSAIALDIDTGAEIWRFDPAVSGAKKLVPVCRGVAYFKSAAGAAADACHERIFLPTADARLIALDAATGRPCADFGTAGTIDLWQGQPNAARDQGLMTTTSPPLVAGRIVIIGSMVADNMSTDSPSGVIRAFDAISGRLLWNFDPAVPDDTAPIGPGRTYTPGTPNSWSIASADEAEGLVYLPMGGGTPDQFGGLRDQGSERFGSSVVALEIATGRLRWVYQTVHHDLWDMDVASQPSLVDLEGAAGRVPALVVPTKRGDLFVLDRRTGTPIVAAPERPVPEGAVAGDWTAPTQPFSALSLLPERALTEADMWGIALLDELACRIRFRHLRYEGQFTPPSTRGTLVYPGNAGVIGWGGVAIDPRRQIAFANPSFLAFVARLIPRPTAVRPPPDVRPMRGTPYHIALAPFLSPLRLPCQAPPWGSVAGIDLTEMRIAWQHPNGTTRDNGWLPLPFRLGVPSVGGPIVTAGGVAFLTGTFDSAIRAYDVTSGRELWQAPLPAGGQATPMSYRSEKTGRQYVIAVAGGHFSATSRPGDAVIAYALPEP